MRGRSFSDSADATHDGATRHDGPTTGESFQEAEEALIERETCWFASVEGKVTASHFGSLVAHEVSRQPSVKAACETPSRYRTFGGPAQKPRVSGRWFLPGGLRAWQAFDSSARNGYLRHFVDFPLTFFAQPRRQKVDMRACLPQTQAGKPAGPPRRPAIATEGRLAAIMHRLSPGLGTATPWRFGRSPPGQTHPPKAVESRDGSQGHLRTCARRTMNRVILLT